MVLKRELHALCDRSSVMRELAVVAENTSPSRCVSPSRRACTPVHPPTLPVPREKNPRSLARCCLQLQTTYTHCCGAISPESNSVRLSYALFVFANCALRSFVNGGKEKQKRKTEPARSVHVRLVDCCNSFVLYTYACVCVRLRVSAAGEIFLRGD